MPARETQIVRTETIVVDTIAENDYHDLIVTDKAGNDHKIGNKRATLFAQFVPGRATEVGYATYMNREYIATAKLVEIGSHPVTHKTMPETEQTRTPDELKAKQEPKPPAAQEIGMWWKEMGEMIRSGDITKDYPKSAVKIKKQYYDKLFEVLNIDRKE